MAQKILAQKFDKTNKSQLKTKGVTTRTGASTSRNKVHAHGRVGPKPRGR